MYWSRYGLSLFSIILLNLIYFVWQPFSKDILCFPLKDINASDLITNILFFTVCFIVYIVICNIVYVENYFKKLYRIRAVKSVAVLFLIQLISDIVKITLNAFIPDYKFIINDLLAVLCFVLSFVFLLKYSNVAPRNNLKKHLPIIMFSLSAVVFLVFEIFNFKDILSINQINQKFYSDFALHVSIKQNYQYTHEVRSMLVEIICNALVFSGFYFKYAITDIPKNELDNKGKPVARVVASVILISAFSVMLLATKTFALPKSSIGVISRYSTSSTTYILDGKLNLESDSETIIRRRDGYKEQHEVCRISEKYFQANNQKLYTIKTDDFDTENIPKELYTIYDYNSGGTEFKTYGNELLILKTNKSYRFIELEDIESLEYDERVVEACEYMIQSGVFSYFEYGYKYLLKYDNEFIEPYIVRFSNGEFMQSELYSNYNIGIKTEYIQNIALKANKLTGE